MKILHQKSDNAQSGETLGPYRIESLIQETEEGGLTAYRVCIEAGRTTSESYHKLAEEIYFVIEGSGIAMLDDVEYNLVRGDFLRLPPGTRHKFITDMEPLLLLDVHSPGSRPDRDVYFTGETPEGFTANG